MRFSNGSPVQLQVKAMRKSFANKATVYMNATVLKVSSGSEPLAKTVDSILQQMAHRKSPGAVNSEYCEIRAI